MKLDGIRVARYYSNTIDLLDPYVRNDRVPVIENAGTEKPGTPPNLRRPQMSRKNNLSAPQLTGKGRKKMDQSHWNAGSTIKVGLSLATVADAASTIRYPGLQKPAGLSRKPAVSPRTSPHLLINEGKEALATLENKAVVLQDGRDGRFSTHEFNNKSLASPLPSLPSTPNAPLSSGVVASEAKHVASTTSLQSTIEFSEVHTDRLDSITMFNTLFDAHDSWLKITGGAQDQLSCVPKLCTDIVYSIPSVVGFVSGTIKHIATCSRSFREHTEGILRFPTITTAVLGELIAYMYWHWFRSRDLIHSKDKTQGPNVTALVSAPFRPQTYLLFDVMDAAVYFDLPDLVDICAFGAAMNFDSITSFGDLLRPLVRNVVSRLSIGDLCICEYDLISALAAEEFAVQADDLYCDTIAHTKVDTKPMWARNYLKIRTHLPAERRPRSIYDSCRITSPASLSQDTRGFCVRFYVEECLRRELPVSAQQKLLRIIEREAERLATLQLTLGSSTTRHLLKFWMIALEKLPRLKQLELVVEGVAEMVPDLLYQNSFPATCVRLVFLCSDSAKMEDLALIATGANGRAGQMTKSRNALPLRVQTEWDPAFPRPAPVIGQQRPIIASSSAGAERNFADLSLRIKASPRGVPWRSIASALNQMLPLPLSELNLANQNLGAHGGDTLASALATQRTDLQRLNLGRCRLGAATVMQLAVAMRDNTTLEYLDLSWNIEPEDPQACDAARAIASALQSGFSAIKDISLSGNHLTTLGVVAVIDAVSQKPRLHSFDFSQMDLNASLAHLGKSLRCTRKRMKSVNLSDTRVLPRTLGEFCTAILARTAQEALEVEEFNLSRITYNSAIVESLGSIFKNGRMLITRLILQGSDPECTLGDGGCSLLLDQLHGNKTLKHLDLSTQLFGDVACKYLARALRQTAMEELILADNLVGNRGVRALQSSFQHLRRPVTIDLDRNIVSPDMGKRLEDALAHSDLHVILATNQKNMCPDSDAC